MSRTSRPYDLSLEEDRRAVIASALGSQRASGREPDAASLAELIALCRSELGAEEVWLFGSRARGDHHPDSDWDLLAILPDDAPEEALDPVLVGQVRRRSGLNADLLVVTRSDFLDAQDSVTTLSAIVAREGVRVDRFKPEAPGLAVQAPDDP